MLTLATAIIVLAASPPNTSVVSCYLRGGTVPSTCCARGRTCLPFDTWTLDRDTSQFILHSQLNCYPQNGSEWGTGDLSKQLHKPFTVATCEAACLSDQRCDAVTVGPPGGVPPPPPPPPSAFDWIRAIEDGPPNHRYVLNASTYLIDRQ